MRILGSWNFSTYDKSELDWEFAPFAKPEGGNAKAEISANGPALVKGSKSPDQAWEFMKWEYEGNDYKFFGRSPCRTDQLEDWGKVTFNQHPEVNYMLLAEAYQNCREQDRITEHACWQEMYTKVIGPRLEQLRLCQLSAEQMLSEFQTELQKIADECPERTY